MTNGLSVTEDDLCRPFRRLDFARKALERADPRLLALVLTHLTGDIGWTEGDFAYLRDRESEAWRHGAALIRRRTAELLSGGSLQEADYPRLDDETLLTMQRFLLGQGAGPERLPKLKSTLGYIPSFEDWTASPEQISDFTVLVIGAGISGIAIGTRLKHAGIPFQIVEKNSEVGGTWYENDYPGCAVDTPSETYHYENARQARWSRRFAKRDEILAYLRACAKEAGITDAIHYNTCVTSLDYKDRGWKVTVRDGDGFSEVLHATVIVAATGTLNKPKIPSFAGMDAFRGSIMHPSQWDHRIDVAGRRVALIGTGSSGAQLAPYLAENAAHLSVFQRTPHWVNGNPNYQKLTSKEEAWLLANVPFYARWRHWLKTWVFGDRSHEEIFVDSEDRTRPSKANEQLRKRLLDYMHRTLPDRPDLWRSLTPTYPPRTKRIVIDNGWYQSLLRDDVDLITTGIDRFDAEGIVTSEGEHVDADIVVMATGFHNTRYACGIEIRGRDGRTPADVFGADDDMRSYLGTAIRGFPNLFLIPGPNSTPGHGGAFPQLAEMLAHYVLQCVRAMIEGGYDEMEIKNSVFEKFNSDLDAMIEHSIWNLPDRLTTRYANSRGRIVTQNPWSDHDIWERTREVNLANFDVRLRRSLVAASSVQREVE
jgi:4-hydroxyacetophenone monooxygenase